MRRLHDSCTTVTRRTHGINTRRLHYGTKTGYSTVTRRSHDRQTTVARLPHDSYTTIIQELHDSYTTVTRRLEL